MTSKVPNISKETGINLLRTISNSFAVLPPLKLLIFPGNSLWWFKTPKNHTRDSPYNIRKGLFIIRFRYSPRWGNAQLDQFFCRNHSLRFVFLSASQWASLYHIYTITASATLVYVTVLLFTWTLHLIDPCLFPFIVLSDHSFPLSALPLHTHYIRLTISPQLLALR